MENNILEYYNNIQDKTLNFSQMNYNSIKDYTDRLKAQCTDNDLEYDVLIKVTDLLKLDDRKNVQSLADRLISFVASQNKEIERVKAMYGFDIGYGKNLLVAGVDEVGRGPLAGPIVAAAVILDLNPEKDRGLLAGIKDSKKLTSKKREELSEEIRSKAISYGIASLDNNLIDTRGIAWCNNEVFRMSVSELNIKPGLVLSDGYAIKNINLPNKYVIKGDEKSASIACASIIAKVYRDNMMREYSKIYPGYGFEQNAGYGTKEHIDAIKKNGPSKIHRMSFLNNIV